MNHMYNHIHVQVTALGVLCCFALFVCLTLLASFFLPSHLSFKNMYIVHVHVHESECLGCAVYVAFPCCLFDLACFFLPFFSSLIKTCMYMYVHVCDPSPSV